MTNTADTTTATIEALDTYAGDNIWQDVILRLDGYDETATDAIDDGQGRDFVAGGVHYHEDQGTWTAR